MMLPPAERPVGGSGGLEEPGPLGGVGGRRRAGKPARGALDGRVARGRHA